MKRFKKYLLCLFGITAILGTTTSCHEVEAGGEELVLTRCWQLASIYGVSADVNLFIYFGKDGKFTICQLTKEYDYVVFKGSYSTIVDGENSILSGVYDDGEPWTYNYIYEVNKEERTLTLESVENPAEISVYKPATMPDLTTRSADIYTPISINKPL